MFDDAEQIEGMTTSEYRRSLYYFRHPDEYPGDFCAFRDKVIDYITRLERREAESPIVYEYKRYIREMRGKTKS